MLAHAELAAESIALAKREKDHLAHIAMLKAELARWQEAASAPPATTAEPEPVSAKDCVGHKELGEQHRPRIPYAY